MISSTPARPREHYWDTLRAFAMLLGIPYHVALCYRNGVRSPLPLHRAGMGANATAGPRG